METKVGEPVLTKYSKDMNRAQSLKEGVIVTANYDNEIIPEAKEQQKKQKQKEQQQTKPIDVKELKKSVQPIVNRQPLVTSQMEENSKIALQPTRNNERLKDKGHKDDEDIIQFNTPEKEGR